MRRCGDNFMHDTEQSGILLGWLARGWALVPLHNVDASGACSCGAGGYEVHRSAGKHPRARAWQDESQLIRATDPTTLSTILAVHPEWNWGVATGRPSGMWVLDWDIEHNAEIRAFLSMRGPCVEGDFGTLTLGPTGGGGRHYVFELPPDFEPRGSQTRNRYGLPPGLDVRGYHGQVVVAPSVSGKGPYGGVLIDAPVRRAPAWLEDMLRPKPEPVRAAAPAGYGLDQAPVNGDRAWAYARSAVNGLLAELAAAEPGTRDDTTIRVAFRLVELGNAPWSGYTLDTLEQAWTEARMQAADHAAVERELPGKWRRAVERVGGVQAALPPSYAGSDTIGLLDFVPPPMPYAQAAVSSAAAPMALLEVGDPAPIGAYTQVIAPSSASGAASMTGDPRRFVRRVNLGPYLDGSYAPPEPAVGAPREDGRRMLYPGRWHTLVGLTGCGKTWLGLAHARAELWAGRSVAYLHFEETEPGGTIERLRALGVPEELIDERLIWLSCERRWSAVELYAELQALAESPSLAILDGINAACSQHGWSVEKPESVGAYRQLFVAPFEALGAAVLSLGHPPKAKDRQDERHGFGSTAWLDEVDGVGFRLKAGTKPVRRGRVGTSALYVVKDRYGRVEGDAEPDGEGWTYVGQFVVDDTGSEVALDGRAMTGTRLTTPEANTDGDDRVSVLADEVAAFLELEHMGGRFGGITKLREALRAYGKISFDNNTLGVAVAYLRQDGRLSPAEGGSTGGYLVAPIGPSGTVQDPQTGIS
jgi:hypothetical protein